jgi:hypothetical protein
MGSRGQFARQQSWVAHVCFGSKADIVGYQRNVRFTPKSGHWLSVLGCPLCAKTGHASYFGSALTNANVEPWAGFDSTQIRPPWLGYGQSQAGAALLARDRIVGLLELLTQLGLIDSGDAGSRVTHRYME